MFSFWRYHRTHPMTFPNISDQKILKPRKRSYATTPTCAAASLACCSSFFLCLSSCDKSNSSEWCLCSRSFYYNNVLREDWKAKDFSQQWPFLCDGFIGRKLILRLFPCIRRNWNYILVEYKKRLRLKSMFWPFKITNKWKPIFC